MGNIYNGIVRTTFILNNNKEIIKIYNNVKVKNHAKEVIEYIKSI